MEPEMKTEMSNAHPYWTETFSAGQKMMSAFLSAGQKLKKLNFEPCDINPRHRISSASQRQSGAINCKSQLALKICDPLAKHSIMATKHSEDDSYSPS